jgi:hypothetical protein
VPAGAGAITTVADSEGPGSDAGASDPDPADPDHNAADSGRGAAGPEPGAATGEGMLGSSALPRRLAGRLIFMLMLPRSYSSPTRI